MLLHQLLRIPAFMALKVNRSEFLSAQGFSQFYVIELSTRERVNSSTPSSGKLSSTLSGILPKRPVGISTTAVEGAGGDQELKKLLKKKTQVSS